MKLTPIASNMTELVTPYYVILFSYETPVACYHNGEYHKTTKKWSATTTRHINKWLGNPMIPVVEKPQEFFDNIFDSEYKWKGSI